MSTHFIIIFCIAALFLFTPPGWIVGLALSFAIEKIHVWTLDATYHRIKLIVASYRILAASIVKSFGGQQYGAEKRVVRIAVEVVQSQPAIQYTYIKTLRIAAKEEEKAAAALARPPCSQVMGVTLEAHTRAGKALKELYNELDRLESHKEELVSAKEAVSNDVFTQWKYLRHQIKSKKRTKLD